MTTQPEPLRLADELTEYIDGSAFAVTPHWLVNASADELRRLYAENERLHQINQSHELKLSVRGYELQIEDLLQANEAFGKRQEWWNERMFALEKQRDELLEALKEAADYLDYNSWVYRHGAATIAKVKGEKQ